MSEKSRIIYVWAIIACTQKIVINQYSFLQEFDIDFYLRLMWTDPRLNFTHLTNATNTDKHILVEPPDQVWIPDVFMENSKHAEFHMVTKKNEMLRLWPNGSLFYSVRYVLHFT